jgi:cation:H+ antiporter
LDWFELGVSLLVILLGAQLFTNGVEWIGDGFGLSEGMVGSVLAAVGTALPETVLPFVAILSGAHADGKEIGVGAIIGAPFMLSTLAMVVLGISALGFARSGGRSSDVRAEPGVLRQDLAFFLVMFASALVAGVIDVRALDWALALGLVVAYGFYVRRHYRSPGEREVESEVVGEIAPLMTQRWARRLLRRPVATATAAGPPVWMSVTQTLAALALIVLAARVFVAGMSQVSKTLGVPSLVFALLVAPVATELPEQFNAVLWIRRRKDTLAAGNVTGAMVFQSSFPVSVGLLFTPWKLDADGLVAGAIALAAGLVVFVEISVRRRLPGWLLLANGAFYVGYVVYLIVRL